MKNSIKHLMLAVALAFAVILPAAAQIEKPITWSVSARQTSDTEGMLYIRANIEAGWHLYSTSLPAGGPKPTSFSFKGTEGVEFTEPVKAKSKAVESVDSQFGISLAYYEETALFTRTFKITDKNAVIKINVTFMGCDNHTCLPPATLSFTIPSTDFRKPRK